MNYSEGFNFMIKNVRRKGQQTPLEAGVVQDLFLPFFVNHHSSVFLSKDGQFIYCRISASQPEEVETLTVKINDAAAVLNPCQLILDCRNCESVPLHLLRLVATFKTAVILRPEMLIPDTNISAYYSLREFLNPSSYEKAS